MKFLSTRNSAVRYSAAQAILQGISPDGGLFVPETFPVLDYRALLPLSYAERAAKVLAAFIDDMSEDALLQMTRAAYARFGAPLKDGVLELYHGPTLAFKDMALQILPHLMRASCRAVGETREILILVATSGDTGKAALEGFAGQSGTRVIVFYPDGGVSEAQKLQMVTQEGDNVRVVAVEGNFDDAQTGVKRIFTSQTVREQLNARGIVLSSANSINIGRLAPQVMYYFKAYGDLLRAGAIQMGEAVDFVVPTGNFGNILAGYLAKKMGLPVGKFLCASNSNKVLTDFLITGAYDRNRPFHKTISPSMDILISSNLERLVYLACDGDCSQVAGYMDQLSKEGRYTLSDRARNIIQEDFLAGCADDGQTKAAIQRVYNQYGYLMDTHTAVAWDVADQVPLSNKTVILSTASPYKFCASVLEALGEPLDQDDFAQMEQLQARTGVPIPPNLAGLRQLPVLHRDVISRDKMEDYVLELP